MQGTKPIILDSTLHFEPTNSVSMGESLDAAMGHFPVTEQLLPEAPIIRNMLAKILQKMRHRVVPSVPHSNAIPRLRNPRHPNNRIPTKTVGVRIHVLSLRELNEHLPPIENLARVPQIFPLLAGRRQSLQ